MAKIPFTQCCDNSPQINQIDASSIIFLLFHSIELILNDRDSVISCLGAEQRIFILFTTLMKQNK